MFAECTYLSPTLLNYELLVKVLSIGEFPSGGLRKPTKQPIFKPVSVRTWCYTD